jgi:hypothetical protein
MKHLLNEMSEQEKNSIRGQHTGGKVLDTTKFRKLLESKLGNAKPLISEQGIESYPSMDDDIIDCLSGKLNVNRTQIESIMSCKTLVTKPSMDNATLCMKDLGEMVKKVVTIDITDPTSIDKMKSTVEEVKKCFTTYIK